MNRLNAWWNPNVFLEIFFVTVIYLLFTFCKVLLLMPWRGHFVLRQIPVCCFQVGQLWFIFGKNKKKKGTLISTRDARQIVSVWCIWTENIKCLFSKWAPLFSPIWLQCDNISDPQPDSRNYSRQSVRITNISARLQAQTTLPGAWNTLAYDRAAVQSEAHIGPIM